VQLRREHSAALGRRFQAAGISRVNSLDGSLHWLIPSTHGMHKRRCIDKAGGLDAYILNTPDKKLGSDVGAELRKEMLAAKMVPPPRRIPKTI
jgi:hypothetical protein